MNYRKHGDKVQGNRIQKRGMQVVSLRAGVKKVVNGALVLVFAALVLTAGGVITSNAKSSIERAELAAYCQQQEEVLVKQVRSYLEDLGYRSSGVTLTKAQYADGNLEYRLTVHHRKIDRMSEEERAALLADLSTFTFPLDNCSFVQEILTNN